MRLMFILATAISAFIAVSLLFFQATRKTYPGFGRWTAGVGFLTLGYALMCLRGFIPEPVSILLGNVVFPLGMVLHLDGIRRFLGVSPMSGLWYALPGIDLVAIAVLYYLYDSPAWRLMVTSMTASVPHWVMAALVFRQPVKHKSMFYPVIGSLIGLAGAVILARPVAAFLIPQWHLLVDSPFQIGTLALLIVLQLGESLSLIMLNSERVESELVEAETELRSTVERLQDALAEQKRTEESLRESEERYRTFFATSRDCVFITALDGRFIDFNDVALEMMGYAPGDRQEALSKNVAEFYANPEEREAHSRRVQELGFSKEYPVDFRKIDGTIIHALVTTVARKGPDGKIIGFQGIVRDITEQEQAREALAQSEERLNRVLTAATDGFWDWDLVTGGIRRSPGWRRILGYSLEETVPDLDAWQKLVHPDDLPRVMKAINDHLAGVTPAYTNEYRILTKSGDWIWIQDRGKIVERDDRGKPLRVAGAFHDINSRKQAEQALEESEERFRSLFESSLDAIFLTAPDGRVFNANEAACRMFGSNEQELREMGRAAVVDPSDPRLLSALEERNRTGRFTGELNFRRRDGTIVAAEISSVLFRTARGDLRASIIVRDVSERKKAEEELRGTRAELYAVYENSPVMMCVLNEQRQVLYTNRAFAEFVGKPEDELKDGRACGVFGCINALDDPRGCGYGPRCESCPLRLAIEDTYRTGVSHRAVEYRTTLIGTVPQREVVLLGSTALVQAPDRSSVLLCLEDVTDRKRAEEALRESEEKYKLLVEKAHESIFVVQDTVFRFVNPAVEEILGLPADQLLGNSFVRFVHPDDRDAVVERHYRRLKGDTLPSRYSIRIIDGQGAVKWVEIDSMMIDWGGKHAVMVFLTDISYRKLAEEAAVQTERLQAIADLSAGVAHHFNNLLQVITGSTSLSLLELESGDLTQIKPTLESMLDAVRLGAETVRRLQTFANIRADITEEEAATFDISATARNAAEISKPLWKAELEKRGARVNLRLDLEDGCLVHGKENELFEVLVNLMRNAAEAMPDGGDIQVATRKEGDEVVINVRDTGIGIAAGDLPRVFQPFWSTRGVSIGKGMGLAVTHGLVKRHGGGISVQSRVGEGSTFTIRLPLSGEPVAKTEQPPMRPAEHRLTILVIEDEPHIATLVDRILAKAGHRVFRALSGQDGLAIFVTEHIDLVICDLGMPGMSGWDVGSAIRSTCEQKGITKPPFILLTGWGGQELEADKIVESGTDAVVAKPIDSAALLATVQEIAAQFSKRSRDT